MRCFCLALLCLLFTLPAAYAKVVVFHEPDFPTVDSEPVSRAAVRAALGRDAVFAGLGALKQGDVLRGADLLVLPYGSAVPAEAWAAIDAYLQAGGNLLVIGGQPLSAPVDGARGHFVEERRQQTYSRAIGFLNSYAVPSLAGSAAFAWRDGYGFLPKISVRAKTFFAVEGRLNGLGYMMDDGDRVAAPVIVADHLSGPMQGARIVALDFHPQPGYWASQDGLAMIGAAAGYAKRGAAQFWTETEYAAIRPGEVPELSLHLRQPRGSAGTAALTQTEARVELLAGTHVIRKLNVKLPGPDADAAIPFHQALPEGFYTVRATWLVNGRAHEFYSNGFWVEKLSALEIGPALSVKGDFLHWDGKPWFPVGTNYFSTEANGWDFAGPRNGLVWERDFADMERHGVSFVRTGVWMANASFVDLRTGGVNERFLRNMEGFLAAAREHHIAINFTLYAFVPKVGEQTQKQDAGAQAASSNPYLNPAMIRAEHAYVLSVVRPFRGVPWLSWDLINEPSFSNPRQIFHGNVPNGDADEVAAWHEWLRARYGRIEALAAAWAVPANELGSFDEVPLPAEKDMQYSRYGNPDEVRALDYNMFAQAMFARWVHGMVAAIRGAGSTQLIDVGQDEGGVTDRVLNQFYATGGVSFTTNHSYWQDDALLWDSVAAKHPGIPQITGETGYQPVWSPDGTWRYNELTGQGLEERKWALGFAAGASGALQWDWDREVDFGIERSDGSAKVWEDMMRDLGRFATEAAPWATGLEEPQVAIVLPQSYQLSVYSGQAIHAQQTAVRVLYHYNHTAAYAVGEYQIGTLGSPRLIILPSAYGLTKAAWQALLDHVRAGTVLLISGPFAKDAHLHDTKRAEEIGLGYKSEPLELRDQQFTWAGKPLPLTYAGMATTILSRAELPGGADWAEKPLGRGRILFSALPLEMNDRLDSIAAVYAYAIHAAGVKPAYTATTDNPGILIAPTLLPEATLYVLTSETSQTAISFRDERSKRTFKGRLEPGRAALLLVGRDGKLIASYHWHVTPLM